MWKVSKDWALQKLRKEVINEGVELKNATKGKREERFERCREMKERRKINEGCELRNAGKGEREVRIKQGNEEKRK